MEYILLSFTTPIRFRYVAIRLSYLSDSCTVPAQNADSRLHRLFLIPSNVISRLALSEQDFNLVSNFAFHGGRSFFGYDFSERPTYLIFLLGNSSSVSKVIILPTNRFVNSYYQKIENIFASSGIVEISTK
jgi:hypothetical protein